MDKLFEIFDKFDINGKLISLTPYGEGHINHTFLANVKNNDKEKRYIFQKINGNLFKDTVGLMNNILLVTEFIKNKATREGKNVEDCLYIIKTKDGEAFYKTEDGGYRVYNFIDGKSFQTVENADQFYQSAVAFGEFAKLLANFDATSLVEVLPDFHNTEKRLEAFKASLEKDTLGRAKSVKNEIEFVLSRSNYASKIVSLLESGKMPYKVTHNDTKLNNVMFDKEGKSCLAVIDLDTIMPGSLCYDFGDSIRFGCNHALEDEKDLSKVNFDLELFDAYAKGYLSAVGDGITQIEKDNLAMGSILMTYECGMRFLKDHLDGDVYFKIHRENHNLDRARTQFKLVSDMEKVFDKMKEIINKY